jgi:hypothetical protein
MYNHDQYDCAIRHCYQCATVRAYLPIESDGTLNTLNIGAHLLSCGLCASNTLDISPSMCSRPTRACDSSSNTSN